MSGSRVFCASEDLDYQSWMKEFTSSQFFGDVDGVLYGKAVGGWHVMDLMINAVPSGYQSESV